MKEKPRFLYRGVTINYEMLNSFNFIGVQMKPPYDYDRIENGRKIRDDGNEYGVYMSDNIEVATGAYGYVDENAGSVLSKDITYGMPPMYIKIPSVGLTYRIDTTNIDAHIPYIQPQWKGHYNNGFEGDEWVADSIPPQAYSIVSVIISPDVLHDKEEIKIENESQIGNIIRQKIEERKQRLERFLQELKKMTLNQRRAINRTNQKVFKNLFGKNGVAYIEPDEIKIVDCEDYIKYLFSSVYKENISNPNYPKLLYIKSLQDRLSGDMSNQNVDNIIMLIKKDLNDIETKYNAYLENDPQQLKNEYLDNKKEMAIDVLNLISRKKSMEGVAKLEDKNYEEKLKNVIDELSMLSEKYRYVTSRMENLMKNNSISPQQNFDLQIQSLISERDKIQEKISMKSSSKKTLESLVNSYREVQTNAIISELNRVLDIQISDIDGYVVEASIPIEKKKTVQQLEQEKTSFLQKLDQLYFDGIIDIKKHNELKSNLSMIYSKMINIAPHDIKSNTNSSQTPPPQAIPKKEIIRENTEHSVEKEQVVPEKNVEQVEEIGRKIR